MARKRSDGSEPAPRKKDTRDRREEQKDRRAAAAKGRQEARSDDPRVKSDKRTPEGRQAADEAKDQRGWSPVTDPDLQSPPGGTQREIWVKDPEDD